MGTKASISAAPADSTYEEKPTVQGQPSPESAAEGPAALSLQSSSPASASGHVTTDLIDTWHDAFASSAKNRLASTVLSKTDWAEAIINRSRTVADQQIFNTKISLEGNPVTDQKRSGRCWLFAFTNNVRIEMMKKYDLEEFQLSQSYLFFVDSLSKANYFLEQMLDLADTPLDDRLVQVLFSDPEQDGGQWDMIVGLVDTFGLVPQATYPESFTSSSTRELDVFLTSKLREYAVELRSLFDAAMKSLGELSGKSYTEKKSLAIQSARKRKEDQMSEVYRILAITLGAPPKPDEPFVWEYYSKDKKYHRVETTPISFYKDHCLIDASRNISLIDDPRHEYDALYSVDRLGSVVGQRPVSYVNAGAEKLKETAIKLLKADHAVWFGCDVGKSSSRATGLMDADLWNLKDAFDTTLGLDKAARLRTGDSAMTHAMLITAVHLENDKPIRWRVENSWGSEAGTKGYMCMSDEWFTEHVFQVVAPRDFIDKKLIDLFDHGKPVVLPRWDPMGALA
ncbi:C1 family peptidase [Sporobolomyces koalae]|uniref:C1 family peptidase n=1 Tax=Sporobolomyces koalae TaxID=500713 RepID=UPI0031827D2C